MKLVIFGGGGQVARHAARLAKGKHEVVSVIRDDTHAADLSALGATPTVFSLESSDVPALTDFIRSQSADAVIFSAGAGGKGGPERTRAVDYDAAVRVFDACEALGVRVFDACEALGVRVLLVSAIDTRDRSKGYPEYYTEESRAGSDRAWKAIGTYMQAKYDSEVNLHTRTKLAYTVLRPGLLTHDPATGVDLGITQMSKVSREAVAQVLLACAENKGTVGLTLDVMDGDEGVTEAVARCAKDHVDAWEK